MPNHGHYGRTSDVRWNRAEEEWYLRCPDCANADRQCWWPLGLEFWDPKSMQRCRACNVAWKKRVQQELNRLNPHYDRERNRIYAKTHRHQINLKVRERRARKREQDATAA